MTTTDIVDPRALLDVLRRDKFTDRRVGLRSLAHKVLTDKIKGVSQGDIKSAFEGSPIVGKDSDQVNVRPSHSGLRDALDEVTLMGLCVHGIGSKAEVLDPTAISPSAVLNAIRWPVEDAAKGYTKTGYIFGRPAWTASYDPTTIRRQIVSTLTDITSTSETSTSTSEEDTSMDKSTIDEIKTHIETICDATGKSPEALGRSLLEEDHDLIMGNPAQIREALRQMGVELGDGAAGEAADAAEPAAYTIPDEDKAKLIDLTLSQAGLPPIKTLVSELNDASKRVKDAEERAKRAAKESVAKVKVEASGEMPEGKIEMVPAHKAFGITRGKKAFSFEVPTWKWDGVHPHVPEVDENYIFRPSELLRVLYALVKNKRAWLHGHSGTGKTTLIEQVAARLNWPVMRLNFDSEITRMDLIGRDTLKSEGGTTVSEFEDGILPQMLSGPYIGIFDEMDFIRPDVSYVMQRVFEGNGLTLTEDGGRVVTPHPMFRIFATANTVGQGDEHGMYQGARPQSMAMLDRFTTWIHVDYLSEKNTDALINRVVPDLPPNLRERLVQYVKEHIEAFKGSKVLQPISPRGYLDMAEGMVAFMEFLGDEKKASKEAMEMAVLDKASQQDRVVLKGIIDRVFA